MNIAKTMMDVEYEQPQQDAAASGSVCATKHAWARVPVEPGPAERAALKDKIRRLLKEKNAVMVSHYYVHPDLQDLAEETGGLVSDSLEMARFGRDHAATTLVVSGVRFMGETSKILSPEKRVLMPDLDAGATGAMTGGAYPDGIRKIVDAYAAGRRDEAADHYQQWLPLINFENRQGGILTAKALMKEGGVIACEAGRHPFPAMHPDTRAGLIDTAKRLDPMVLRWGR